MFGEWSEVNLTDLLLFGGLTCSFDVCFWTFSKLLQGNMAFVDVLNKLRVKEFLAESAALSRDVLAESSRRHVVERHAHVRSRQGIFVLVSCEKEPSEHLVDRRCVLCFGDLSKP